MLLTISSSFEQPFLAVQANATITPPPNITRRNTANFHPWSLCGMSFLALGSLATSVVETPRRDAFTKIVLSRLLAFSHAIFVGLLLEVDLDDFTCTWSIFRDSYSDIVQWNVQETLARGHNNDKSSDTLRIFMKLVYLVDSFTKNIGD